MRYQYALIQMAKVKKKKLVTPPNLCEVSEYLDNSYIVKSRSSVATPEDGWQLLTELNR